MSGTKEKRTLNLREPRKKCCSPVVKDKKSISKATPMKSSQKVTVKTKGTSRNEMHVVDQEVCVRDNVDNKVSNNKAETSRKPDLPGNTTDGPVTSSAKSAINPMFVKSHKKRNWSGRPCKKRLLQVQRLGIPMTYSLNCSGVVDEINLDDLRDFLRSQIKIGGKTDNYGDNIKFEVRDSNVYVTTELYVAKKKIRDLVREYIRFKKLQCVHIQSETKMSYQLVHCA